MADAKVNISWDENGITLTISGVRDATVLAHKIRTAVHAVMVEHLGPGRIARTESWQDGVPCDLPPPPKSAQH